MFQNDIYRCHTVLQFLVKLLCMLQSDIFIDVILFYSFLSSCFACSRVIYLLMLYCFMASGQVSIILMVPVHVERPCQAAQAHVQKVSNVSEKAPTAIQVNKNKAGIFLVDKHFPTAFRIESSIEKTVLKL